MITTVCCGLAGVAMVRNGGPRGLLALARAPPTPPRPPHHCTTALHEAALRSALAYDQAWSASWSGREAGAERVGEHVARGRDDVVEDALRRVGQDLGPPAVAAGRRERRERVAGRGEVRELR